MCDSYRTKQSTVYVVLAIYELLGSFIILTFFYDLPRNSKAVTRSTQLETKNFPQLFPQYLWINDSQRNAKMVCLIQMNCIIIEIYRGI